MKIFYDEYNNMGTSSPRVATEQPESDEEEEKKEEKKEEKDTWNAPWAVMKQQLGPFLQFYDSKGKQQQVAGGDLDANADFVKLINSNADKASS